MSQYDKQVKKRLGALLGKGFKEDSPRRKYLRGDDQPEDNVERVGAEKFGKLFDHKDDAARLFRPKIGSMTTPGDIFATPFEAHDASEGSSVELDPEAIFLQFMSNPAAREEKQRRIAQEARERVSAITTAHQRESRAQMQQEAQLRGRDEQFDNTKVMATCSSAATNCVESAVALHGSGQGEETCGEDAVAWQRREVEKQEAMRLAAEIREAASSSPELVEDVTAENVACPLVAKCAKAANAYVCQVGSVESPIAAEKRPVALDIVRDDRCYVEAGQHNADIEAAAMKGGEEEEARNAQRHGFPMGGFGGASGSGMSAWGNADGQPQQPPQQIQATNTWNQQQTPGQHQPPQIQPWNQQQQMHGQHQVQPIQNVWNQQQHAQTPCQQQQTPGLHQQQIQNVWNQQQQTQTPGQQQQTPGLHHPQIHDMWNQQQQTPGQHQHLQMNNAWSHMQQTPGQPQQPQIQNAWNHQLTPGLHQHLQQTPGQQMTNACVQNPQQQGPCNPWSEAGNGTLPPWNVHNPGAVQVQPAHGHVNSFQQPQGWQGTEWSNSMHQPGQSNQGTQGAHYQNTAQPVQHENAWNQNLHGQPQHMPQVGQGHQQAEANASNPGLPLPQVPAEANPREVVTSRVADTTYDDDRQMPLWAHGLDPSQLSAAAASFDQPQIVSAGPGAGKTHYLVARTLRYKMENAKQGVACVTFSREIASEVDGRIRSALKQLKLPTHNLFCGTIHKLALRIVRTFSQELGFGDQIKMANNQELQAALKLALAQNHGGRSFNNWADMADDVSDDEMGDEDVRKILNRLRRMQKFPAFAAKQEENTRNIYASFKEVMRQKRLIDVNDLIPLATRAFQFPIAQQWATDFLSYLLVDEFQDSDCAQIELFRRITGNCITAVGDEDQMIYGWRMSKEGFDTTNPFNIFEQLFFNSQLHVLERNYRSPPEICKASSELMLKAISRRSDKVSTSMLPSAPQSVQCVVKQNTDKEVEWIIRQMRDSGLPWNNFAILARLNSVKESIERKLRDCAIPTKGPKVKKWDPTCLCFLGYLKLSVNVRDDKAFLEIYNKPKRGLGAKFIVQLDKMPGNCYYDKLKHFVHNTRSKMATNALSLVHIIDNLQPGLAIDALQHIGRLVTMEVPSILTSLAGIHDVNQFLAETREPKSICVSVCTIHGAKGLEWNTVFVARVNEGVLPMPSEDGKDEDEERRLLYVAMTRARQKLYLSCALNDDKQQPLEPSHFLCESGVL